MDFGRLTPREFECLQEEWLEEQRRQDWRSFVIYRGLGGSSAPGVVFQSLRTRKPKKPGNVAHMLAAFKAAVGGHG